MVLEPAGTSVDVPVRELNRTYGGEVEHIFRGAPWEGFSLKNLPEAAALALSRDPRVRLVEEDAMGELTQAAPQHAQWGLDRTNQSFLPLDYATSAGCEGGGNTHIYIMDTGISNPNGAEFGTRLIDGYKVPGFVTFRDDRNHGTSVASIAGGSANGVARSAKIVNVKIFQNGSGSASYAIAAIRDFINGHAVNGPKVANISAIFYGSGSDLLAQEINYSISQYKITYVASAAAGDASSCGISVPENMGQTNGVIVVGASFLTNNYTTDSRSIHLTRVTETSVCGRRTTARASTFSHPERRRGHGQ